MAHCNYNGPIGSAAGSSEPACSPLPCPFCGATPQAFDGDFELLHRKGCFLEDVESRWLIGDSHKLEAWNRRAHTAGHGQPPAQREVVP